MGNFNRDRRPSGDRSYGGGSGGRSGGDRFGGRRDFNSQSEDRPMFETTCSKCGKSCEVPFRPTGDRPVFCRDCFRENGGNENRREERPSYSRPSFDNNRSNASQAPQSNDLDAINSKLDKILKLLTSIDEEVAQEEEEEIEETTEKTSDEEVEVAAPEKKKRASKKSA